jgi:hypothetical protein
VIIKNRFRLFFSKSGAVKEYFFAKQDPAYRPVASNRQPDYTTAELPVTTDRSAGWGVAVCRVKTFCGCLPVKTEVRMILFNKKTPLDRTLFNGSINGTFVWYSQ